MALAAMKEDTRQMRNVETGMMQDWSGQSYVRFDELPVGAVFRMVSGRWLWEKLSHGCAKRHGDERLGLAHHFEGTERCIEERSATTDA